MVVTHSHFLGPTSVILAAMDPMAIEGSPTGLSSPPVPAHVPADMPGLNLPSQDEVNEQTSQVPTMNSSTPRLSSGKGHGSKKSTRMDTFQHRTAGQKRQAAVQDAELDVTAAGSGESTRPRTSRTQNLQQ